MKHRPLLLGKRLTQRTLSERNGAGAHIATILLMIFAYIESQGYSTVLITGRFHSEPLKGRVLSVNAIYRHLTFSLDLNRQQSADKAKQPSW
jgi:hypothetical protein